MNIEQRLETLRDVWHALEANLPAIMTYMLDAPPDVRERMKELYARMGVARRDGTRQWLLRDTENTSPAEDGG